MPLNARTCRLWFGHLLAGVMAGGISIGAPEAALAQALTVENDANLRTGAAPIRPASLQKDQPWLRVHLPDPVARHALRTVLDRAAALLAEPHCGSVVADFSDRRDTH